MKLTKLYQTDFFIGGGTEEECQLMVGVPDTCCMDVMEKHVAEKIGIPYYHTSEVPFQMACRLLHYVNTEFYQLDHSAAIDIPGEHWMSDDFVQYMDEKGEVLFYQHYVHGDCGSTWFKVD